MKNKGRNLDYGHTKSDSGEGKMAKTTLLTMGRDLYNLYMLLNDQDDLPQWCHYKLAKSSADLSTVTDYLTSKITKLCIDKNIDTNTLRLHIKESLENEDQHTCRKLEKLYQRTRQIRVYYFSNERRARKI